MMRLHALILGFALIPGVAAVAAEPELSQQLVAADGWVGYHVPMIGTGGAPCCYAGNRGTDLRKTRCDLDSRGGTFVSSQPDPASAAQLSVYWHVADGKADRVRAFAADCAVTSHQPVRWIDPIAAADSVGLLKGWITGGHHGRDSFDLAALALHADAGATTALIELAAVGEPIDLRKDAIFWLGHARGAEGADFVERVAIGDANADLREHAVFALSQSNEPDAYERVRAISKRDASGEVRGKAMFWMAQMHDPRAQADILAALGSESSNPVREEAVFALSQLDEAVATKALIAVIRGNYPRPVKEKALFWLGQAGTDEAMAFLDEVLTR
ncbi:HEAT repeat domain-containing protein [Dokdonella immobilis]|uniref:HEAT repeat n=1 Tax=Dokdonella immobilis TaxID=578942 RepID=A0A1I4YEX0_9GAMM|nr:HEAT repeat domain-containing protein [Dokdonella immobilis]SFN36621.1 HEAT repeat [Dokdonella immobilis]